MFDKYTNYKENAGVSSVVFGAEKPVLEVEMNEIQEVQKTMLRRVVKNTLGDGITDLSKIVYQNGAVKVLEGCALAVNGYMIECSGLSVNVTNGTVYLQVWEDTVSSDGTLKEGGNQQSTNTVNNYFKDSRTPVETSRRKVLKYTLGVDTVDERQNLAIATVEDGVMTKVCREISMAKLNDKVIDLQVQMGTFGEGVLGVEVDLENNTIKRVGENETWTPGADYDRSEIYGKRIRVNTTNYGVVVAKYGDAAYTETGALTVDTPSDYGAVGVKVQSVVMQPHYYYKRIPLKVVKQTGVHVTGYHLLKWIDLISPVMREGFKLHPAFKLGDDKLLDYYFIGENDGCIETSETYDMADTGTLATSPYSNQKFSSIAGAKPASGTLKNGNKALTRDAVRKLCSNRGNGYMQEDITIASSEQMLFLIEYASFSIQDIDTFGDGITNMPSLGKNNDSVPCPANTTLGNGSGVIPVSYTHLTEGTVYNVNVPVYRGVKNPFGNIWKFIDGFLRKNIEATDCNEAYWQDGSKAFSDAIADYIPCGFSCATLSGYVKYFGYSENCDFMYMPSLIGGDSNKPVGDDYWVKMSNSNIPYIALLGSYWSGSWNAGLFCWDLHNLTSYFNYDVGGRLCRKSKDIIIEISM